MDFKIIKYNNVDKIENLKNNFEKNIHVFYCDACMINKGGFLIIDFGKEICGRLHIQFASNLDGSKIRVRLGESVYETCAELTEKNAGNYHSLRDMIYPVVSFSDFSSCESGFRFVRLDCIEALYSINIAKIFVEEYNNGLTILGDFNCNDNKINDIFEVAQKTISLCVRKNDIWDGIKRDRLLWIGDFYPELLSAFYTYGDIPQFEYIFKKIIGDHKTWINSIPSYSAWWIICLSKYYKLSGNIVFVNEMIENVKTIVNDFSSIILKNGKIDFKKSKLKYFDDNEYFIDWPTNLTKDSEFGWRYLITIAMQEANNLFETIKIKNNLPNEIINRLSKFTYEDSNFKQVTALGVLSNQIDNIKGKKLLENNCLNGMTCFMSFAIIEALKKVGDGEKAFEIIKEYYGKMIDLGATTFWEDFDIDWLKDNPQGLTELPNENRKNIHADFGKFCYTNLRMSLCHGWSTGFIDFFYTYVLGVIPTQNGYDKIKIEPHLCNLSFVEGKIPTKHGIIYVKHTLIEGKIKTEYKLPKGVVIE